MQLCLVNCLNICTSWKENVLLNTEARNDFDWWSVNELKSLTPDSNKPDLILFTDACLTDWLGCITANASWTSKDSTY